MRAFVLILTLALWACNAPAPAFRGIAPTRVVVDGSVFDVRVKGTRAEAIRTNTQYAPRAPAIHDKAAFAIAQVSGCRVTRMTGDQAQAFATLACGSRDTRQQVEGRTSYACYSVHQPKVTATAQRHLALNCDPV